MLVRVGLNPLASDLRAALSAQNSTSLVLLRNAPPEVLNESRMRTPRRVAPVDVEGADHGAVAA